MDSRLELLWATPVLPDSPAGDICGKFGRKHFIATYIKDILMVTHFSKISGVYNDIRTTDIEPIQFVSEQMGGRGEITGADIGVGAGRYSLLLLEEIEDLYLTCADNNEAMLKQAGHFFANMGAKNFDLVRADSADLPFQRGYFDCVFTFNSIHHFDLSSFLAESARVLKDHGLLFVYTRLRAQNETNIWGRYFPDFNRKEGRLYDLDQLESSIRKSQHLALDSIKFFHYERCAPLERLVAQANARHYSTFALYESEHLERALGQFKQDLRRAFDDENKITWTDENIMLTARARR